MPLINGFLTENTADISAWILDVFFRIPAQVIEVKAGYKWQVCATNVPGVKIAHPCNAFELYCLYLGFIVAMADVSLRRKLFFGSMGVVMIYFFNALRVVALFLIQGRWPQVFDFMHKYLFQASAYLLIFGLWYGFLRKYGSHS
jgi:exosortase/archaeosortase family protein